MTVARHSDDAMGSHGGYLAQNSLIGSFSSGLETNKAFSIGIDQFDAQMNFKATLLYEVSFSRSVTEFTSAKVKAAENKLDKYHGRYEGCSEGKK